MCTSKRLPFCFIFLFFYFSVLHPYVHKLHYTKIVVGAKREWKKFYVSPAVVVPEYYLSRRGCMQLDEILKVLK